MTAGIAMQSFEVDVSLRVNITVHDPDVIERVTGPEGDEWRSQFYRLFTAEDVLEHLAYNAIYNGVEDVSRLDGWADLDSAAVTVELTPAEGWEISRRPNVKNDPPKNTRFDSDAVNKKIDLEDQ